MSISQNPKTRRTLQAFPIKFRKAWSRRCVKNASEICFAPGRFARISGRRIRVSGLSLRVPLRDLMRVPLRDLMKVPLRDLMRVPLRIPFWASRTTTLGARHYDGPE